MQTFLFRKRFCLAMFVLFAPSYAKGEVAEKPLIEEAKHLVQVQYGFSALDLQIDENELAKQVEELDNKVTFIEALRKAMESFLQDDSDIESPLHLLYDLACERLRPQFTEPCFAKHDWHPAVKKEAKSLLVGFLNQSNTILRLLRLDERPEAREDPHTNWIFYLYAPSLSDHLHWVVVDRAGVKPVYNYGFN